ncbi:hypothetical protein SLS56_006444 [Neofusicoccum ribis]|uniref:Ankyrin repeat protein n=1 Tax=Neofusicoccum ribis TaxID=45134 RepID=A0ABR3SQM6_9PEZI
MLAGPHRKRSKLPKLTFSGSPNEVLYNVNLYWNHEPMVNMTELLMWHGVNPLAFRHVNDVTSTKHVIAGSECPEVRALLEKCATCFDDDSRQLAAVALMGTSAAVMSMLQTGVDANTRGREPGVPRTPLQNVVWNYRLDVADYLISVGADVTKPDIGDRAPFFEVLSRRWCHGAKLLVRAGADLKQPSTCEHIPFENSGANGDVAMPVFSCFGLPEVILHCHKTPFLRVSRHRTWTQPVLDSKT